MFSYNLLQIRDTVNGTTRRGENSVHFWDLHHRQCDQMAELFLQYLTIYHLGTIVKIGTKWHLIFDKDGSKCCQILNKPWKNAKHFFAKVAKFLQIRSRWFTGENASDSLARWQAYSGTTTIWPQPWCRFVVECFYHI